MNMNIQVRNHSARIAMSGRFDFGVHRDFKNAYMTLLGNADVHEIELEMSKVDYLDSAALGMLLLLHERAKDVNKPLALLNPSGAASQMMEVANFSKFINIKNAP